MPGFLIASLTAIAAATAAPSPEALAAERAFMLRARAIAADEACDLFGPAERRAREAGLEVSRAELRAAGAPAHRIDAGFARAAADPALSDCASDEVASLADAVRGAHRAYMQERRRTFSGPHRHWAANRGALEPGDWAVVQSLGGEARLGWALDETGDGALLLATAVAARPASAVLVLRDPARAAPTDATAGGLVSAASDDPLAAYGPPAWARRTVFASRRIDDEFAGTLLSVDEPPARRVGFAFPAHAFDAMAKLDPRESARVELRGADGSVMQAWWIEIGALRAAVDFIAAEDAARRAASGAR